MGWRCARVETASSAIVSGLLNLIRYLMCIIDRTNLLSFTKQLSIVPRGYFYGMCPRRIRSDHHEHLIYLHVGKCGGSTLLSAIRRSETIRLRFSAVSYAHFKKPTVYRNAKYMLVVRHPIARAVSAFNWRYKLVVVDEVQKDRFVGEYDILVKYGSLEQMALALYENGVLNEEVAQEFRSIHHLKEDIAFYLSDLLENLVPEQLFAVLTTEHLNADIERVLGIVEPAKIHENHSVTPHAKLRLSEHASSNLRNFLKADFECLDKLADLRAYTDEIRRELTA